MSRRRLTYIQIYDFCFCGVSTYDGNPKDTMPQIPMSAKPWQPTLMIDGRREQRQ